MDGLLVCDKPAGPTSHDVVATVRRLTGQRRVGHGGTLDPPATGVLIIVLGRATRLLPYLPLDPKVYLARVRFGTATDTLDATGTVTDTADASTVGEARLRAVLPSCSGPQEQVPPMVSAVKLNGEPLYRKARRGEVVERRPRRITVHALELVGLAGPAGRPEAELRVSCSAGTYVRVLAAQLGEALGTVAHLAALRRTSVGPFRVEDASTLETLAEPGGVRSALRSPAEAMLGTPSRPLDEEEEAAVRTGRPLRPSGVPGPVAAIGRDGRLLAVLLDGAGAARPRVVLA